MVMAFMLLIFAVVFRASKNPVVALFIIAFITCTTGLGYILRKFAIKKREGY